MERDLADRTADELEDELATLSAHLAAGMCRWLELVAELDRRGGFAAEGAGSCSEWLSWRCAVSPRSAREHVRVARSLGELPLIHTAFAGGELSYAKVRALSRVATPESEEALLEVARLQTAAQLERTVRAYRRVSLREAREQQDAAQLAVFWNGEIEPVPRLPRGDPAELTGRNRNSESTPAPASLGSASGSTSHSPSMTCSRSSARPRERAQRPSPHSGRRRPRVSRPAGRTRGRACPGVPTS